jgi:hypothetical protein
LPPWSSPLLIAAVPFLGAVLMPFIGPLLVAFGIARGALADIRNAELSDGCCQSTGHLSPVRAGMANRTWR